MLDEENPRPARIIFQDKGGEDQGPLAPGTSTPGVVVDGAERGSDPTSDASDPRYRGRPSCESPHSSPPEEDVGNTREGGEPAEASMGMCQHHRVIRPPLTPTKIQTARTQRPRMPSFPLILPKSLQQDSVLSENSWRASPLLTPIMRFAYDSLFDVLF